MFYRLHSTFNEWHETAFQEVWESLCLLPPPLPYKQQDPWRNKCCSARTCCLQLVQFCWSRQVADLASSALCFACSLRSDLGLVKSLFLYVNSFHSLQVVYTNYLSPAVAGFSKTKAISGALCAITLQCPKAWLSHLFTYKHVAHSTWTKCLFLHS